LLRKRQPDDNLGEEIYNALMDKEEEINEVVGQYTRSSAQDDNNLYGYLMYYESREQRKLERDFIKYCDEHCKKL